MYNDSNPEKKNCVNAVHIDKIKNAIGTHDNKKKMKKVHPVKT